jgi:CRISPR-associated endonuclease/helicase Cas3
MPMDPTRLWAKSKRGDEDFADPMLLPQHLKDVHAAAVRVLDATAEDQLAALRLDALGHRERLQRCVLLAAAVHDLGKANDHFQGMIRGVRDVRQNPQGLRHEWVTVLMLKQLRPWLLPAVGGCEVDFAIVEWAVAGHHPAFDHPSPPTGPPKQGGSGPEIKLLTGCKDFATILGWLAATFSLAGTPPELGPPKRQLNAGDVFSELRGWARTARRAWEAFSPELRRFVAAVKNSLIAADVAGSALPRELPNDPDRWRWITDSFGQKPTVGELALVVAHRLKGGTPRAFQSAVAASAAPVTFVKAGCGSGKTLAAYMWARDRWPGRRLYFCYPTTGTTTEGFKDYLFPPEADLDTGEEDTLAKQVREIGANLFHSRREVDFEIILGTGGDSDDADKDAAVRVESLDAWSTPIVACTVDTVLGLVQNNKRGLFAWPALAGATFVFDEIHAYDDRLFGALLRFLRDLPGVPALLMTASLPNARLEALRNALGSRESNRVDLIPIPGPKELEELPRYHKLAAPSNDPLPLVAETLAQDGKVLWVCNTVGRVRDAARRAEARSLKPLLYHSRFKYEDRVERHRDVIEAFKGSGPALAICSQVAEMSLDLSADLLVTDLAPVPALIQRLGRLNRRAKPESPTKPFLVVELDQQVRGWHLPYLPAELEAARVWLGKLPDTDISQRHLASLWEQSDDSPPDLVPSAWLDGGPTTTVTELREASSGITVLMREDIARVRWNPKQLGRFALPMPPPPRGMDWRTWKKERGLPIAEPRTIAYDEMRGAEWAE